MPDAPKLITRSDTNTASWRHPRSAMLTTIWRDVRTVMIGTRAVVANAEHFLPKHPKERPEDYRRRSRAAEFFNAYKRTVIGLAGLPFSRPPKLADSVPQIIRQHWETLDAAGTHGDVLCRRFLHEGLAVGAVLGVVDVPMTAAASGGAMSRADEERARVRPYWTLYLAEDVMSWRTVVENGRPRLSQLVLREVTEEEDGDFGTEEVIEYLVYRHPIGGTVTAQRYREERGSRERIDVLPVNDETPITKVSGIPAEAFVSGEATSLMTGYPALMDLLDTNIGHFRLNNNRRWLMELCCVPVPVKSGGAMAKVQSPDAKIEPEQAYGPNVMLKLPSDGKFYWAEPAGNAFGPSRDDLDRLERHMAALGLAFLAGDKRAAETDEAKRLQHAAQNTTLAALCDAFDDWVERMLVWHAEFTDTLATTAGGERSGGEFQTNREFEQTTLAPEKLEIYSRMQERGQLTLESLWGFMRSAGELGDDFDADAERERLALARGLPDDLADAGD